jgi:plastocyanin
MNRSKAKRFGLAGLAMLIAAAVAVPAMAQPSASARVKLSTIGGVTFKANRFIKDGMRFNKDTVRVRRGDTLVLRDKTKQPHTLSIVRKGQLPRKVRQIDGCFEGGPCGELFVKHGAVNPETGEEQDPTTPVVNEGREGLNRPGDSTLIPPGGRTTIEVSGARDMYYLCAVHPWMQGKIDVRRAG